MGGLESEEIQEEESQQAPQPPQQNQSEKSDTVNMLSHPGEQSYQVLLKWSETNRLLDEIALNLQKVVKAEERRNEIAEEDYSEDEEETD